MTGLLSGASYKLRFIAVSSGCANVNYVSQYYNTKSTFVTADAVTAPGAAIDAHLVAAGSIGGTVTDASTLKGVETLFHQAAAR